MKIKFSEATTSTASDAERTEDATTAVKSEKVILDHLFCGLSGGNVGRARHPLKYISNSEHVSVNPISERIYLHDTDKGLAVLDFLADIQVSTKNWPPRLGIGETFAFSRKSSRKHFC